MYLQWESGESNELSFYLLKGKSIWQQQQKNTSSQQKKNEACVSSCFDHIPMKKATQQLFKKM